jgi:xylan 1,4-beta-xylosidase
MSIRSHSFVALCLVAALGIAGAQPVTIQVDASKTLGTLKPVYSFFGYDEPNYTYMKDGQKLLSELAALSPVTVHVRAHSLLVTGDGTPALKWGSTNAYTEDANGNPVYNWTILDRIFDTYIERGMKPLVQIGFMPKALSTKPEPYQHQWDPKQPYGNIFTGWAYPPRDYEKWAELVYQWVRHSVERYGKEEVESWYWELWNEPDSSYWQGTVEEYCKLYDYTAHAVKRAAPGIRMGGPHVTGPANPRAEKFFRAFLEHVIRGRNHVTGQTGSPIDFIGFHAKGRPNMESGHVQMGSQFQLRSVSKGFEIVASYPELKHLPIIIGESDPEGCAACSVDHHPQNAYRNGTMYPSYTAATFARKHDLQARHGVNFEGAVTWAFEFEDQPYFAGFRDLATNGIDKPVLNVFRMFGMMGAERVEAKSSGAVDLDTMMETGVKGQADVGSFATRGDRAVSVMVWNYHDDDLPGPAADIDLSVSGMKEERVLVHHYRVDQQHSNSYEAWKALGSPQKPTAEQYKQLERAGQLEMLGSPQWRNVSDGRVKLQFQLPRQGVSMLQLSW